MNLVSSREASAAPASKAKQSDQGSCPICNRFDTTSCLTAPDRFHGRHDLYHLVRCSSCSLVWLANAPPPSEMYRHYGPAYDRIIAAGGADPEHWTWRRDKLLRYKSSGTILDLGCSSGSFLGTFDASAWKLFGVEMSSDMAAQTELRCGAKVFVGDILDAPFPPCSFDVITCFNVFEHCYRPAEVLARVAAWLKPGGIFYTMMPNIDSAGARIFRSYWYALELPRHLFHFSPTTLRALANAVGLGELSMVTRRELYIEPSTRYVLDHAMIKLGAARQPLAYTKAPMLPWRILRKLLRLTVFPMVTLAASLAGEGESIHAFFVKPTLAHDERYAHLSLRD